MGRKKSTPRWHEVQEGWLAVLNTEDAEALAAMPTADAVEVPAQDATPNEPAQRKARKRSRVHEVYETDPTDTTYSICQCLASTGRVCKARIRHCNGPSALGSHLKKKHPSIYASLVSDKEGDIAVAEATATSSAQLTLNVSYEQMINALSSAPPQIVSFAIESLQQVLAAQP